MRQIYFCAIAAVLTFLTACQKDSNLPFGLDFKNGVFSCSSCLLFGRDILFDGQDLYIADYFRVFWFTPQRNDWKLKQVIEVENEIGSFKIHDNRMHIAAQGKRDDDGLYIYEKKEDSWKEIQFLKHPNDSSMEFDFEANHLILNANSKGSGGFQQCTDNGLPPPFWTCVDVPESDTGKVYFYEWQDHLFTLRNNFKAGNKPDGYECGGPVSIQMPYAYSSCSGEINVYFYDGQQWNYVKNLSPINNFIAADDNRFIGIGPDRLNPYSSYLLEGTEIKRGIAIEPVFADTRIRQSGQRVRVHDDHLAISLETGPFSERGELLLFEYDGNRWLHKQRFYEPNGSGAFAHKFDFSDDWMAILSGGSPDSRVVYLYGID